MPRKTTRLFVGRMKSVGFVDRGACEGADILTAKSAIPEAAKMLKKVGEEFVVYDADGTTELGRHKTKAKAQAQLAAIEANASKRALMPDGADWGEVLKLAGATARPLLDEIEALFWSTAQKAEEACAPKTFNEVEDLAAVRDEMWKVWDRFRTSVNSIVESDAEDKAALLATSVTEFSAFLTAAAPKWAGGKSAVKEATMPTPTKQDSTSEVQKASAAPPTLSDEARKALPAEARTYLEHVEAAAQKAAPADTVSKADHDAALQAKDAEIDALTTKLAAADPNAADEAAFKALPPSQQALVTKARKDAEEALKIAADERDRREVGEAVAAAKALAPLGKPSDLGPALRRIKLAKGTAEDFALLDRTLASAAEIASKSPLFRPLGQEDQGTAGGTAAEQVETLARKRVDEKGETIQKARVEVRKAHRDLARQEHDEARAARH